MPRIRFTGHLRTFFPTLTECSLNAGTVADVVTELNRLYPGMAAYLVDETGALRKHVNIFVGDTLIKDRKELSDAVGTGDEVYVMQALSGG